MIDDARFYIIDSSFCLFSRINTINAYFDNNKSLSNTISTDDEVSIDSLYLLFKLSTYNYGNNTCAYYDGNWIYTELPDPVVCPI